MTDPCHYIILAAGMGSRFQQNTLISQHKALAPLWDHRGTLELLLEHLKDLQQEDLGITVATGYLAEVVEQRARRIAPNVGIFFNDSYADDSMLTTLIKVVGSLTEGQSFWVLFADTLYSRQALELMHRHRHSQPTVAIMPHQLGSNNEIVLSLTTKGTVSEFNPFDATHQMAHAVYWPSVAYWRNNCIDLLKQTCEGLTPFSQWHLLNRLTDVATLELPNFAAQDIDTQVQLKQLRPQINSEVMSYFNNNLNKDNRSLIEPDIRLHDQYFKQCESVQAAEHEARVLQLVNERLPCIAPQLISVDGLTISMHLASGIRLYDLLRQLKACPKHERIREIILTRCSNRLSALQKLFKASDIAVDPYPFDIQVSELLRVLCLLLKLPPPPEHELEILMPQWNELCTVPFRDATPKNIIVVEPTVSLPLTTIQRKKAIEMMLEMPETYWQKVPLQDIDFTSTHNLTSLQDDWLSLLGHAVNRPSKDTCWPSDCLPLCDLTLLVRYLRFGGRKLIYKMVNPTGFNVRFQYDEPCYYFASLCMHLSNDFQHSNPYLMTTLRAIRDKAEQYRGVKVSGRDYDPYLSITRRSPQYWQESPLELN